MIIQSEELSRAILLQEYEEAVAKTDKFDQKEITPILLGLYGEVGSVMSTSKKYRREKKAYVSFREAVDEEFGDTLWYFAALCRRINLKLSDVFEAVIDKSQSKISSVNSQTIFKSESLDTALISLGYLTAKLLKEERNSNQFQESLIEFARLYLQAIQSTDLIFSEIVKSNLIKVLGRFTVTDIKFLPDFDVKFPEEEQLPRQFEIHIAQRSSGQTYLRWNGVFIGSPLTDNIKDPDGYRFHDVFHLANAAVLHWSPTFRALIKHKRKSNPEFDEQEDGGRAVIVEEGLTAWLFSYSKGLDYFDEHKGVSFDVLKMIQKFIHGYEVEGCPLKLWEDAILQGYSVFRQIRKNSGGVIIGDRKNRKISYRPIGVKE